MNLWTEITTLDYFTDEHEWGIRNTPTPTLIKSTRPHLLRVLNRISGVKVIPGINATQFLSSSMPTRRHYWNDLEDIMREAIMLTDSPTILLDNESLLSEKHWPRWPNRPKWWTRYALFLKNMLDELDVDAILHAPSLLPSRYDERRRKAYAGLYREILLHNDRVRLKTTAKYFERPPSSVEEALEIHQQVMLIIEEMNKKPEDVLFDHVFLREIGRPIGVGKSIPYSAKTISDGWDYPGYGYTGYAVFPQVVKDMFNVWG